MAIHAVTMVCLLAALAVPGAAGTTTADPTSTPTPTATATPTHVPTQTPGTRDLSQFHAFSFTRNPAFGFCPPLHAVYAASIQGDGGGSYHLQFSVLEEGREGIDDCVVEYIGDPPCVVARAQPERELTGEESERLRDVFSHVQVHTERDLICERIAVDPCIIHEVNWDDVRLTDYVCSSAPRVDSGQLSAIVSLLEGFRDPASPCTGDCDDSGAVSVDELLRGVSMALGTAELSECPGFDESGDAVVTIDEIIKAVGAALTGCPR